MKIGAPQKLIQSKLGGSQKQTGLRLNATPTSKDTFPILGNGAKLIGAKLGGSQKHTGLRLRLTPTSKEIFPILGNCAKLTRSKLGGLLKLITSKLGTGQKFMHWKLGGSQNLIHSKLGATMLMMLGGQHPTRDIWLGSSHPTNEMMLILHGLITLIICGVLHASITEIIILGIQQDGTVEAHSVDVGNIIGGKLNNGPGQVFFCGMNPGQSGISGTAITNGIEGSGSVGASQPSFGVVGICTKVQVGVVTVTVGLPPLYCTVPDSCVLVKLPSPKST